MIRIESWTGPGGQYPAAPPQEHKFLVIGYNPRVLLMGRKKDRLTVSRKVENCRMTPLLVKTINANDNYAYEDYALAA